MTSIQTHSQGVKIRPLAALGAALLFAAAMVWAPPAPGAEIRTTKKVYKSGETITVKFSGAPGYARDWVCIVPFGAPLRDAGDFDYTGVNVYQGTKTFSGKPPGEYEARAFFNYARLGYTISARYKFTVAAGKAPPPVGAKISTSKKVYKSGEAIVVNFAGAPGYFRDWICIVPAGSGDNQAGDYDYIGVNVYQGSKTFSGKPPGEYEARVYYDYTRKGYVVAARSRFKVK